MEIKEIKEIKAKIKMKTNSDLELVLYLSDEDKQKFVLDKGNTPKDIFKRIIIK